MRDSIQNWWWRKIRLIRGIVRIGELNVWWTIRQRQIYILPSTEKLRMKRKYWNPKIALTLVYKFIQYLLKLDVVFLVLLFFSELSAKQIQPLSVKSSRNKAAIEKISILFPAYFIIHLPWQFLTMYFFNYNLLLFFLHYYSALLPTHPRLLSITFNSPSIFLFPPLNIDFSQLFP